MQVYMSDDPDCYKCKSTASKKFTIKSLYADFMNVHTVFLRKYLWKLKIPLKIKIFLWFLNRLVLLTKDNLAKRRWTRCKKCVFCDMEESVEHLFVSCQFAKIIWWLVYFKFNINPFTSISNMFGTWLNGIDSPTKACICIGVSALLWAIWNSRNDIVFNKMEGAHFFACYQQSHILDSHVVVPTNMRTNRDLWILDALKLCLSF